MGKVGSTTSSNIVPILRVYSCFNPCTELVVYSCRRSSYCVMQKVLWLINWWWFGNWKPTSARQHFLSNKLLALIFIFVPIRRGRSLYRVDGRRWSIRWIKSRNETWQCGFFVVHFDLLCVGFRFQYKFIYHHYCFIYACHTFLIILIQLWSGCPTIPSIS